MAYGLKIWTASGYVAFDSENMDTYVKVVTSGEVYLGANVSETFTIPTGFDRVYINGPGTNMPKAWDVDFSPYDSAVGGYTSFTITGLVSDVFGYVAIRLN